MKKVIVNKEVFRALNIWKKNSSKSLQQALKVIFEQGGFLLKEYLPLNSLTVEDICKCLILGYELEETPEDKLLKYYEELGFTVSSSGTKFYVGLTREQEVILETLSILDVKIKGINE